MPTACAGLIARVNQIRRANPALQERLEPAVSSRGQRSDHRLQQSKRRRLEYHRCRRESRFSLQAIGVGAIFRWTEFGLDPQQPFPGGRHADRGALPVARRKKLRGTRSFTYAGAHPEDSLGMGARQLGLHLAAGIAQKFWRRGTQWLNPPSRFGTRMPSFTSCTCARSATATTTASAIFPA